MNFQGQFSIRGLVKFLVIQEHPYSFASCTPMFQFSRTVKLLMPRYRGTNLDGRKVEYEFIEVKIEAHERVVALLHDLQELDFN